MAVSQNILTFSMNENESELSETTLKLEEYTLSELNSNEFQNLYKIL